MKLKIWGSTGVKTNFSRWCEVHELDQANTSSCIKSFTLICLTLTPYDKHTPLQFGGSVKLQNSHLSVSHASAAAAQQSCYFSPSTNPSIHSGFPNFYVCHIFILRACIELSNLCEKKVISWLLSQTPSSKVSVFLAQCGPTKPKPHQWHDNWRYLPLLLLAVLTVFTGMQLFSLHPAFIAGNYSCWINCILPYY